MTEEIQTNSPEEKADSGLRFKCNKCGLYHRHAIEVKGLSVSIGRVKILSDVSLDIRCEEITAIIGPNGAGKTTLLKALLKRIPFSGEIRYCESSRHGEGHPIVGYVPQVFDFDRGLPLTVKEFLVLALSRRPTWLGINKINRGLIYEELERVGAGHLYNCQIGKLSGGELQRVLLAFALMGHPTVLLMDEPITGVDIYGEELFCNLLLQIKNELKLTVVLVSHDLNIVIHHADQVICLNHTVICKGNAIEVLSTENIEKFFGTSHGIYLHHHESAHFCKTKSGQNNKGI